MGSGQGKSRDEEPDAPKTVHIGLGFFFIVNFCLGTGFLGIPYSFYYSGYVAAIPSLLVISFVSWVNATYIVECMARAQALETLEVSNQINYDSKIVSEGKSLSSPPRDIDNSIKHPKFEITIYRKFEQVEMCEMFYGKWMKYVYLVIFTIYSFLALWSFSTVGGSAWASNIPINTSTIQQCGETDFQHDALPPKFECRNAYHLSLSIFGVIVILLSLLDLKEQAIVQMILGLLRFVTVGAIILYCLVNLIQYKFSNKCLVDAIPSVNETFLLTNASHISSVRIFDGFGWLSAIPVFTYAFILHQGIPSLTHPIRQKQYMRWLIIAMFLTAGVCYFSLGIIVSLWFNADVQETCTLNWGEFTGPSSSIQLRILSYYIVLFPSLDVLSAYPLLVHTIVVNVYMIITGSDTSKKPAHRFAKYDRLLRLSLRFFAALIPILVAFGVANLIIVLKFAGLFGFAICFGFPTALQLRSIYVCKNRFAASFVDMIGNESPAAMRKKQSHEETTPLLSIQQHQLQDPRALYMTPYSSKLFSHPIAVCVIGVLGVMVFILTFISLFVPQHTEVCYAGLEERLFDDY